MESCSFVYKIKNGIHVKGDRCGEQVHKNGRCRKHLKTNRLEDQRCDHVFSSGPLENQQCPLKVSRNSMFCRQHNDDLSPPSFFDFTISDEEAEYYAREHFRDMVSSFEDHFRNISIAIDNSLLTPTPVRASIPHFENIDVPKNSKVEYHIPTSPERERLIELAEAKGSIPNNFICPITRVVMTDPVVASDGHSYERQYIEEWLKDHNTSPVTRKSMDKLDLIPNFALRDTILEWIHSK